MRREFNTLSKRLLAELDHTVATVTINAPERRNCIDLETWRAFPALFRELDADADVRVIILRGAGNEAFCTGADISEFSTIRNAPESSRAYELDNVRAFEAVGAVSKPVIALIHGYCFGAGVGLAAACDLRLASESASFAVPAAALGVGYPPGAMKYLVTLMGPEPVKQLFFTAGRISAQRALSFGMVSDVQPRERLDEAVNAMARTIAAGAPMTITAAKRAIDAAAGLPNALSMVKLQELADACFASADYAEGRAAFKDKRKPLFKGF